MSTELLTLGLDIEALSAIIHNALEVVQPGERVLAIIPDKTRDDNTHVLFPIANEFLTQRGVASFDMLVAQGTHPPMTDAQKLAKIGCERFAGRIFDHCWDRADEIVTLGELSADKTSALTDGLIDRLGIGETVRQMKAAMTRGRQRMESAA